MIADQLSLVRFVAEKIHRRLPPGVAFDALVHAGVTGLLYTMEQRKAQQKVLFQTHAKYRIQSEITAYLRALDWVGHAIRVWGRKEARVRRSLTEHLAREAKREEIATALNVSVEEYQRIMEQNDDLQLLTREELTASSEQEWRQAQEDFFIDPTKDPLVFLRDPAILERVEDGLETLSDQEQLVMTLAHYEEMTSQEISETLDLTEEQVFQIRRQVVARLRQLFQVDHGTTA
jgi:RNA polymerase sigma factor for flagellar operon FliA